MKLEVLPQRAALSGGPALARGSALVLGHVRLRGPVGRSRRTVQGRGTTSSEPTSGLGWLADGTLFVVSMTDRKLMRVNTGGASIHADLSKLAPHHCNDLVTDARGRAYVGNFGSDIPRAAALQRSPA